MSFPDWALRHKIKGTELRFINGHYYLYQITSRWNPEKHRAQKITGRCLGAVTPEGLVPSRTTRAPDARTLAPLRVKEYGATTLLCHLMAECLSCLKAHFPEWFATIVVMALTRLLYHAPLKTMPFHFTHSWLSERFADVRLTDRAVSACLRAVGAQRDQIVAYLKHFITPADHLVLDVTHLFTQSHQLSLAHYGYNSPQISDPQVNFFFIFSAVAHQPLFYRLLPGNIREIKACQLTLKESGITDAILIGDKGFYSRQNVAALREARLNFILPLRRTLQDIDYTPTRNADKSGFAGHFAYGDRFLWYQTSTLDDLSLHLVLDERLRVQEEQDYLARMAKDPQHYTQERFQRKCGHFGTLALLTDRTTLPASTIYTYYKGRNEIEVMIDALKNILQADHSYMQDDTALEGWSFINFLALTWYYAVYHRLREKELLSKYAPMDILHHLMEIKQVKIGDDWHLGEITDKTQRLIDKLGFHIT